MRHEQRNAPNTENINLQEKSEICCDMRSKIISTLPDMDTFYNDLKMNPSYDKKPGLKIYEKVKAIPIIKCDTYKKNFGIILS